MTDVIVVTPGTVPTVTVNAGGTTTVTATSTTDTTPVNVTTTTTSTTSPSVSVSSPTVSPVNVTYGTPGPAGISGGSFTFTQNNAASVWTITHNLGYNPAVTATDISGNGIFGDVAFAGPNALTITFSGVIAGYAYLS